MNGAPISWSSIGSARPGGRSASARPGRLRAVSLRFAPFELVAAFPEQHDGQYSRDEHTGVAHPHRDRVVPEDDLKVCEQPVEMGQCDDRKDDRGEGGERSRASHVPSLFSSGPPYDVMNRSARRSVSNTHSIPNAQPPTTSLGQCTPSITRL